MLVNLATYTSVFVTKMKIDRCKVQVYFTELSTVHNRILVEFNGWM